MGVRTFLFCRSLRRGANASIRTQQCAAIVSLSTRPKSPISKQLFQGQGYQCHTRTDYKKGTYGSVVPQRRRRVPSKRRLRCVLYALRPWRRLSLVLNSIIFHFCLCLFFVDFLSINEYIQICIVYITSGLRQVCL